MGTEGDRRAIAWAQAKFKELGFDRVWIEEVDLDHGWIRGEARAEIVSPYPHNIVLTALGYSVGTHGDLVGELVEFETFDDLEAVPEGDSLDGNIAFVSYSMNDYVPKPGTSRMAAYGEGTKARGRGHVTAAKRGAEADCHSLGRHRQPSLRAYRQRQRVCRRRKKDTGRGFVASRRGSSSETC